MHEADDLTTFMCRMSWKSGSLNLLEPSGPHRACYGTHLPLVVVVVAVVVVVVVVVVAVVVVVVVAVVVVAAALVVVVVVAVLIIIVIDRGFESHWGHGCLSVVTVV